MSDLMGSQEWKIISSLIRVELLDSVIVNVIFIFVRFMTIALITILLFSLSASIITV